MVPLQLEQVVFEHVISDTQRLRVAVREYRGRRALDIRTFYKDGQTWKPGKGAWITSCQAVDGMIEALTTYRAELLVLLNGVQG